MVKKDSLEDEDIEMRKYFDLVVSLHQSCVKAITARSQNVSFEALKGLEELAALAYDVSLLREVIHLQALVACFFGLWSEAIKFYRKLVDLSNETGNGVDRKTGFKGLGFCYQEQKHYKIATRCFKKLLETAWDTDDVESEVQAYEGLGLQYFYLGELKKSNYYIDRMARGKLEKQESKIRSMYLSQLHHKRHLKDKNQVSFAQLNAITSKLDEIYERASRQGQRRQTISNNSSLGLSTIVSVASFSKKVRNKITKTIVSKGAQQSDNKSKLHIDRAAGIPIFYRNPFTKEARPILIRPSTAISRAPSNDFPSPRIGMGDAGSKGIGASKNFDVMPHYTEDTQGRWIDSLEYDQAHFSVIVKRRNRHRNVTNHSQQGKDRDPFTHGGHGNVSKLVEMTIRLESLFHWCKSQAT